MDHILYDSIFAEHPDLANLQRQKVDPWLPGALGKNGEWPLTGIRFLSKAMNMY